MLKEAGAQVVVAARTERDLKAVGDELGVATVQADVSDENDVRNMIKQAAERMGSINILINNAGYGYMSPLLETDKQAFEDVWRTNVLGVMLCAREAGKVMKSKREGSIINIASTAGLKGYANGAPYVATKFALRGMTECWRQELRQFNIRVMLLNPSEVMTQFAENAGRDVHYTDKEKASKLRAEEIAHAAISMLSMDDRGFVAEATVFATNPQQ